MFLALCMSPEGSAPVEAQSLLVRHPNPSHHHHSQHHQNHLFAVQGVNDQGQNL